MSGKDNAKLSREAWLERALEVLRDEGIQGVRVERLARDLSVTKGSFYWHFSDREDLCDSMAKHWAQLYSDVIVADRGFIDADDPKTGIKTAMKEVRRRRLDEYELAMRSWADQDPRARKAVREVYRRRRSFLKGLFQRMGFEREEVDTRTNMLLCLMSFEKSLYLNQSQAARSRSFEQQLALLMEPAN